VVAATLTIDQVRMRAGTEIISTSVLITDESGEEVATAVATFVHSRGTE
jgi:hypothetical protein